MTRNRIIQWIACLVLVASLTGTSLMIPAIDRQRGQLQLMGLGLDRGRNLGPKEIVANVFLATFRGIWVDYIWYRANRLKEEGKFFEINQLSEQITSLQPRFPQVWSFNAWNMAYNISVQTHTPDERWDWVNKGIAILRDKGIPYNPRSIRLYRELAWIFFHKCGQYSDDVHWYYKSRLAREWQEVLGAPTDGASKADVAAAMKKIVDAKDTLDEQIKAYPAMEPLITKLRAMNYDIDQKLLIRIGQLLMFTYSPDVQYLGESKMITRLGPEQQALYAAITDPALAPGLEPLLSYLRKNTLINKYKMSPQYMLGLIELYGPIDWRHPAAHGLYWSSLGVKMAGDLRNKKDIDLLNTYRGILHALQELMFRGKIGFDPITGQIDLSPDPRFIDSYTAAMDRAGKELDIADVWGDGTVNSFAAGHENFLLAAVYFSYLYGDEAQAQKYLDEARAKYANRPENATKNTYTMPLADLVLREMYQNIDIMYYARQTIDGLVTQAIDKGLLASRPEVFNRFMSLAKSVYDKYQKESGGGAQTVGDRTRMGLPKWPDLFAETYIRMIRRPAPSPVTPFRLWSQTPPEIQRWVFDRLQGPMREMAQQVGFDPLVAFPEPSGMEQYRKDNPVTIDQANTAKEGAAEIERK